MDEDQNEHLARQWTAAQRSVGAYILSLVPDFHEAEEILQRVAVVLVRKFEQYDRNTPFVAWAIRVAQYEVMYYRRQRATDRHVFDGQLVEQITEAHVRLADEATPAAEALRECLKRVNGRSRQAIDLHYGEGLKPAVVAEMLGVGAGAARMLLLRVRGADSRMRGGAVGGTGDDAGHHLIGWYYGWGGPIDPIGGWAFRIGCSHVHSGYQNPLAAWALAESDSLRPKSPHAADDWRNSLSRQMEFYRWLQSAEGAIAGGATNSWNGRYEAPPAGTPTFYGMAYDWEPVYHDPPSNDWFGFQAWTMCRVAELYFATGNKDAGALLDKWAPWATANVALNEDGTFLVPQTLRWSGQPESWDPANPRANAGLHVEVLDRSGDVGVAASLARTLLYYSAARKQWRRRRPLPRRWPGNCWTESGLTTATMPVSPHPSCAGLQAHLRTNSLHPRQLGRKNAQRRSDPRRRRVHRNAQQVPKGPCLRRGRTGLSGRDGAGLPISPILGSG